MDGKMETIEEYSERIVGELRVEIQAQVLICMLIAINEHLKGNMSEKETRFGGVVLISGNSLAGAKYREVSGQSFDMDGYVLFPVFAPNLEQVVQKLYGKSPVIFPEIPDDSVNVFVFYRGGLMVRNVKYFEPDTESEEFKKLTSLVGSKIASIQEGGELNSILQKLSGEQK
jgi:hypothetical protein